jgi:general secretion pathway protein C
MGTRRFDRGMWVANAAFVGVAAFFGAQGLSAVASMALSRVPALSPPAAPELAAADTHARNADAILRRNPFDSITGSLLKVAYAAPTESATESVDPRDAPPCAKIHTVVIAAFDDPEASVAALEVEGGPVLRRRGGEIGTAKVEYIAVDRVFVRDAGKLCQAQLFAPPVATPAPAAEHKEATPHVDGALDPKLRDGITRDGPGRYRIERFVIDKLIEDQSEIMKGGVIRPEKEGDRTVGVRLAGVRPDRLFGVLGLQDGDVIRSLNGFDFSSPERMLEAFARLRNASQLTLDFTRGGQTTTYDYAIQ